MASVDTERLQLVKLNAMKKRELVDLAMRIDSELQRYFIKNQQLESELTHSTNALEETIDELGKVRGKLERSEAQHELVVMALDSCRKIIALSRADKETENG